MPHQRTDHNHTPWPEYYKTLTTAGYSLRFVGDTIEALQNTWDCPACKSSPCTDELRTLEETAVDLLNGYFRYTLQLDIDTDIPAAAKDIEALVRQEVLAALERVRIKAVHERGVIDAEIARWRK